MKGICKGFNKYISQIFVVKEREMEIGYPTDVKHVAHIGLDGPDGTPPSWMSEYKNGPEFSVASMGSMGGSTRDPTWSSQEFEQSLRWQPSAGPTLSNFPPANLPCIPKKPRRKKTKSSSSSSPRSGSSRGSRSSKSKSVNL